MNDGKKTCEHKQQSMSQRIVYSKASSHADLGSLIIYCPDDIST